jgi:hypothetical protein
MRLLNAKTMKLEEFFDKKVPNYAILSHTWGEDEVTFRDFDPVLGPRRTSKKISGCCSKASKHGHDYVWIDACCIDKSSSAELSEAINSMFAWYQRAEVCYVYLSDVDFSQFDEGKLWMLGESRWFTRGWTLQELLAPTHLKFYNSWWGLLGQVDKKGGTILQSISLAEAKSLDKLLVKITGIPEEYIEGSASLNLASVATKMSWASARQTTRTEDMAYYLLGLFDVAMPMLYGEGTKAFVRLQEEIMKNEDDQTIFAWGYGSCGVVGGGATSFFAKSPDDFANCNKLEPFFLASTKPSHYVTTNKGLHIEMALLKLITGEFVGRINCLDATDSNLHCLAIPLLEVGGLEDVYYRPSALALQNVVRAGFAESTLSPYI